MRSVVLECPAPWTPANRTPRAIKGPARVLILSDIHYPFHDREALILAVEHGVKFKPTHLLINGDMVDFYAGSSFETDPSKRNMPEELRIANAGLEWLSKLFPKCRVIYKQGNHEQRWDRYIWRNAPALCGLVTTTFAAQFPLIASGRVKLVDSLTSVMVGKLLVLHGHEYRFSIQNPVSPARGLSLRSRTTALCGHFHQRSEHSVRDGHGKLLTTWSTGCLCDLSPEFLPRNEWSHGFAEVEVYKDDSFNVANLRIIHGKIYT